MGLIPESGRFPRRRKWQPTPVFLPVKSHGQRSLVVHGVAKESDMTEHTLHSYQLHSFKMDHRKQGLAQTVETREF